MQIPYDTLKYYISFQDDNPGNPERIELEILLMSLALRLLISCVCNKINVIVKCGSLSLNRAQSDFLSTNEGQYRELVLHAKVTVCDCEMGGQHLTLLTHSTVRGLCPSLGISEAASLYR